ncbi:MAG: transposase [Candidatus Endonucleobacter sp. (ex Gigantidas childressi)]|nr:transposase [Candidatus Endonucleobacter sp. (ex Gigantidas childressi)]
MDATPIEAARSGSSHDKSGKPTKDPEAGWHVKNDCRGDKKNTSGFSVHTGVDEDGFIHRQSVTPGNVHDSQEHDTLLLGDETALYADSAYSSEQTREKLAQLGIKDQVQRKGYRGKPLSKEDRTRNKEIAVTRAGGERPFAIYKRHYGLARTRFMGLAKNATIYGLAAIAANIRKGTKFLVLYGVSKPCYTG